MKKILILGGSHRDIPLIEASQSLGYFVVTLGNGKKYLGHRFSDKFYKIDFNDLNKVRDIIKQENIDYIIPGCGEESYIQSVKLVEEMKKGNLDSLKVASLVHNKWRFKEFCLQNNISTPNGFLYQNNKKLDTLSYPVVVKPTTLSGGRGVEVVKDKKAFIKALKNAQEVSNEIFLEEFIEGELIAYSVFIQNQKIVYSFSGKDDTYLNPYLITLAYPISLEMVVKKKLRDDIENIAKKLNFVDGMFHLQVIIKDNIPYIIDVTRRIPGDFYPKFIQECDRVEYAKAVVKAYIGDKVDDEFISTDEKKFILRYVVMPKENGIYDGLEIDESIKESIVFRFGLLQKGEKIDDYLHTQVAIFLINIPKNRQTIISNLDRLIEVKIKKETVC